MSAPSAASSQRHSVLGTPTNVSAPAFEFLLSAILEQVEIECLRDYNKRNNKKSSSDDTGHDDITNIDKGEGNDEKQTQEQEQQAMSAEEMDEKKEAEAVMMNEHAAAKMERMGFDVGYRLVERLAQSKSLVPQSAHDKAPTTALLQLEAVKFICKELWTEVFRKQVDKLQTNHRGVFVLKDGSFKWLQRMPAGTELAKAMAIKILAFPCGLIRGALSNMGISSVVSCDFMDDGKKMNSCSFNVKMK
mmetsp:Transcript_146/g.144  ORF Transcript_146/g.144 Transcript_146/m.144 type:complete len:247 (-) Transcript_146:157-897(-)